MHLVGVIALLQSGDRLDVEDVEAAAAAGISDERGVLIVPLAPLGIAGAVVARRPWRHHHGEPARQRHHVAERADLETRLRAGKVPVGIVPVRADVRGPAVFRLGAVDDLQPKRHRFYAEIRDILIGGRYLDRYERRQGNWKIARRSLALDWCRVVPVNAEDYREFAAGAPLGRADTDDPSYRALTFFARRSEG